MTTGKSEPVHGIYPDNIEHSTDITEDKAAEIRRKQRRAEILEELKEKLGIRNVKPADLQQKNPQLPEHAKDHVLVRTEQWVKDIGLKGENLKKGIAHRTNHTEGPVKKRAPYKMKKFGRKTVPKK